MTTPTPPRDWNHIFAVMGVIVLAVAAASGAFWSVNLAIQNAELATENKFYRDGLIRCSWVEKTPKTQDEVPAVQDEKGKKK